MDPFYPDIYFNIRGGIAKQHFLLRRINMSKLFISLLIGFIAGIIDVTPMIIQKLDKYACVSAFIHWMVLGVVISYVQMPVASYLKGIIIAMLTVLPVLVLVSKEDKKAIFPIVVMSIILGAGVGFATATFAG